MGLAWVFHWYYGLLFFTGAMIAWLAQRKAPVQAQQYTFPVASGIIAGGSLMGVIIIFWENGPAMLQQLMQQLGR